uniref:Uncharacterized protein n=1 Tax=Arundo donax TaxID=35708 RepID=A0A0A9HVB0_ARUDO
MSEYTLSTLI